MPANSRRQRATSAHIGNTAVTTCTLFLLSWIWWRPPGEIPPRLLLVLEMPPLRELPNLFAVHRGRSRHCSPGYQTGYDKWDISRTSKIHFFSQRPFQVWHALTWRKWPCHSAPSTVHLKFYAYLSLSSSKQLSPPPSGSLSSLWGCLAALTAPLEVPQFVEAASPSLVHLRFLVGSDVWNTYMDIGWLGGTLVLPAWCKKQSSLQLPVRLRTHNSLQNLHRTEPGCTTLCQYIPIWAHAVRCKKTFSHILWPTNKFYLPCNTLNECMYKTKLSQSGNVGKRKHGLSHCHTANIKVPPVCLSSENLGKPWVIHRHSIIQERKDTGSCQKEEGWKIKSFLLITFMAK